MTQRMRTALDFGPLVAYLVAFYVAKRFDPDNAVYISTAVAMVASMISLAIYYVKTHKVAPIPAFTCSILVVFGGLTIYLHDDSFVMMKPTIVYVFMGVGLLASALTGKNVLGSAMGPYLKLPPEAWKIFLTRYAVFCFVLAGSNEVLRRILTFEVWLNVKIFGFTAVALLFMFTQMPLIMKYIEIDEPAEDGETAKAASETLTGSQTPEASEGSEDLPLKGET